MATFIATAKHDYELIAHAESLADMIGKLNDYGYSLGELSEVYIYELPEPRIIDVNIALKDV